MRRIRVKVITNSDRDEVLDGDPVVVRVRERAEKGRANRAVLRLLSEHFGCRARIVSGAKSREKVVELEESGGEE
jgi:uncharacterized protein (TIGR00251 family)